MCAFAPGAASAQGRDNVYAVSGVHVDETAANAAAAQQAGFAAAQRAGFERLVRRLTIARRTRRARRAAAGARDARCAWCSSVDVEEERRSGTRYIGRLTVRFDPSGVRTLLRQFNLTVVDTRTAPVLVAPLVADGHAAGNRHALARSLGARRFWRRTRAARDRARRSCKARRLGTRAAVRASARPPRPRFTRRCACKARPRRRRWSKSTPTPAAIAAKSPRASMARTPLHCAPRSLRSRSKPARAFRTIGKAASPPAAASARASRRRRSTRQPAPVGADQGRARRRGADADLRNPHRSGRPRRRARLVLVRWRSQPTRRRNCARRGVSLADTAKARSCASPGGSRPAMEQPRLFEFRMGERSPDTLVVAEANRDAAKLLTDWRAWPNGALALAGPAGLRQDAPRARLGAGSGRAAGLRHRRRRRRRRHLPRSRRPALHRRRRRRAGRSDAVARAGSRAHPGRRRAAGGRRSRPSAWAVAAPGPSLPACIFTGC